MELPELFVNNMQKLLGDELPAFLSSLDMERSHGIRANTLKIAAKDFENTVSDVVTTDGGIPWCPEGFYFTDGQPGRHPYYHAGLYYIQEPSAMFPGASAGIVPGEKVLDICAAPGGKSTQAAARLCGQGLLVSNDINEERTKALVKNIEMAGIRNAIVTNETPARLADKFPGFFDRILVDAPCSGEGMFRKDEQAVKSWESFKSETCRGMQDEILGYVDKMLKPGGTLCYSTCTFAPLENEQTIEHFIGEHPEYFLKEIYKPAGIRDGMPEFAVNPENSMHLERAARLFPHAIRGEGHFTAVLQKGEPREDEPEEEISGKKRRKLKEKRDYKNTSKSFRLIKGIPGPVAEFFDENMKIEPWEGCYFLMGKNLYYLPDCPPDIDGIIVARAGVFMGSLEGFDFKPSHPFAMASRGDDFKIKVDLPSDSRLCESYLKGETLEVPDEYVFTEDGCTPPKDSLCAVCADGFILGMGRLSGGIMKNMYPKGWRRFT